MRINSCSALIQSGILSEHDLPIAFFNRGVAYHSKGDNDRAIQDYDQAIRLNPNDPEAFYNRGNAYQYKGDHDRAIQDFDQAILDFDQVIRLNPSSSQAFGGRGIAYLHKGDNDRAIQEFDQAIRLDPNDADVFDIRGNAHRSKGDNDRAVQDYDQAIRLNPNNFYSFFDRGVAQFDMGQFGPAQKDFAKSLQLQPKAAYTVIWSYLTQLRTGGDGLTELRKNAGSLDLKEWPGKVVDLYLGAADPETVFTAAKDPDPKKQKEQLCEAYFYLAERALRAGNRNDAVQLFQKALETGITTSIEYTAAKQELVRLNLPVKP